VWGERYGINSGNDSNDEKYIQINYSVADGCQLMMEHTTTNQKKA
jgi:hypothetical protein